MRLFISTGIVLAMAQSSFAALTQLPAGPTVGTHAGNLVTGGSFEAGPPNALVYWATGTNGTPFAVPPGWTSSGVLFNYAQWGHTSTSPLNIVNSAVIPDGVKALYFGNGQGASVNMPPNFTPSGEVTFAGTPTVSTSIGAPVILSQTVNTHLSPAPSYILSFWVSGENSFFGGPADGMFGLRVTNTQAGDPMRYFAVPAGGSSVYGDSMRYEFSFTPINPLVPVTIEFYNWGHFAFNGGTTELVLDDVIVNTVPEPTFAGMIGAVGMMVMRRRR
jgi:hypothetical protein